MSMKLSSMKHKIIGVFVQPLLHSCSSLVNRSRSRRTSGSKLYTSYLFKQRIFGLPEVALIVRVAPFRTATPKMLTLPLSSVVSCTPTRLCARTTCARAFATSVRSYDARKPLHRSAARINLHAAVYCRGKPVHVGCLYTAIVR